jgi:sec-independent protein translocase protein TatC
VSEPASDAGELRLTLAAHLGELRRRLFKVVIAVLVVGGAALVFSKELFHFLMAPVLAALPQGEQSLIQTSAVEELNTLIKVGLYAGIFFAAPVILGQIWGFVRPGLYPAERKMAVPFILAGTLCFLGGATFAYLAVLPPAFEFLLKPEEVRAQRVDLDVARGTVADAGRLLRAGDLEGAEGMLAQAEKGLASLPAGGADARVLLARAEGLDSTLDAADRAVARAGTGGAGLSAAIRDRARAREAALRGDVGPAREALAAAETEARTALAGALDGTAGARAQVVAERHAGAIARLAAASEGVAAADWTRPMLSMKEQLNLVLVLLLAFGAIFEIPVIFALLAALGVIDGTELARFRRHAIVVNVIVAAIITPTGDPFNLSLMAVPMILCYEAGIIAAKVIARRRKEREKAALAA